MDELRGDISKSHQMLAGRSYAEHTKQLTGLLIQSLQTGDASISFPIAQLSFVLTAIPAVVVYREVVTRGLILGLSAATLAVLLFALA